MQGMLNMKKAKLREHCKMSMEILKKKIVTACVRLEVQTGIYFVHGNINQDAAAESLEESLSVVQLGASKTVF